MVGSSVTSKPPVFYSRWDVPVPSGVHLAFVELVLSWADLETVDGYVFEAIEREIEKQAKLGLRVLLGLYFSQPGFRQRCVPSWIPCTTLTKNGVKSEIPNITPEFREGQKTLIQALGKRFNGRLAGIELSDRRFGEQNDSYDHDTDSHEDYSECVPTKEQNHEVIDWYFEAFPNTQKVCWTDDPLIVSDVLSRDPTAWLKRASLGHPTWDTWKQTPGQKITLLAEPYGISADITKATIQVAKARMNGARVIAGRWNVEWNWNVLERALTATLASVPFKGTLDIG